jgi:hypothetical protein
MGRGAGPAAARDDMNRLPAGNTAAGYLMTENSKRVKPVS